MKTPRRRLAAIVFTDVVGYSAVVHRDERLGERLLDHQRRVVRQVVKRYGGRVVSTAGDSFLLQFDSTLSAIESVIAIQQQLARGRASGPGELAATLRASVHLGDVEHRGGDLFGDGVNIAARLLPLSPEGGLALSGQALSTIRQRLALPVRATGTPVLKNIETPVEVFVLEPAELEAIRLPPHPEPSRFGTIPRRWAVIALMAVVSALAGGIALWRPLVEAWSTKPLVSQNPSVAVLPFANMSEDRSNGYFADGMQDEILTALSRIKTLKVISRTSTEPYRDTPHRLPEIAAALGVANILEGSVQRLGGRVRINVQLIEAASDAHLWAESYDREMDDLFSVQRDIAMSVARALQAHLLPAESEAVVQAPTRNPKAYDLYLQAGALERRGEDAPHPDDGEALWPGVVALYRQALAEDPAFALAAAAIGRVQMRRFYYGDADRALLEEGREAAELALRLDPSGGEAHVAMGLYHYWGLKDYARARSHLEHALDRLPNDAGARGYLGAIARRQGRWDDAVRRFEEATVLDPRSAGWWEQLAIVHRELRRWPESEAAMNKVLSLNPDAIYQAWWRAHAAVARSGDLAPMRAFLSAVESGSANAREYALDVSEGHALLRNFRAAIAALEAIPDASIYFAYGESSQPKALRLGLLHRLNGEPAAAQPLCQQARTLLEAAIHEQPERAATQVLLGYAFACLGQRDRAIAAVERGAQLTPVSRDALAGANYQFDVAVVRLMVGDRDGALEKLESLLSLPNDYSVGWLAVDPLLDALRDDPRFQKLLSDHAAPPTTTSGGGLRSNT